MSITSIKSLEFGQQASVDIISSKDREVMCFSFSLHRSRLTQVGVKVSLAYFYWSGKA
jgi:hypothetical protein